MHLRDIYEVLADSNDNLMYEAQLGLGTVRRTLIGKRPDGRFLVEMFTFVPPSQLTVAANAGEETTSVRQAQTPAAVL